MRFWANLLGYQAVWFSTVIGAGAGLWWPALAAAALFVAVQWFASPCRAADARVLLLALLCGLCIEGGLAASGWAHYAAPTPAVPPGAPLWILALWAAFAMTLNHSLAYLRSRPALAVLFGAIGAPLAYLGAARGWQALSFEAPAWRGLLWLALGWAIALPLLANRARRWIATPATPTLQEAA